MVKNMDTIVVLASFVVATIMRINGIHSKRSMTNLEKLEIHIITKRYKLDNANLSEPHASHICTQNIPSIFF